MIYSEIDVNTGILEALITKQVFKCCTKDMYKCGIYTLSEKTGMIEKMVRRIINDSQSENELCKISGSAANHQFIFTYKNGSYIKIMTASESCKANKLNSAVVDTNIDRQIVDCVILPTIISYYDNSEKFRECVHHLYIPSTK